MEIKIGATHTVSAVVDETNIASAVGSGLVEVFATPMMVALMELAASQCIAGSLEAGMASVGTQISVSHSSATPLGMKVTATAVVTAVDGKQVEFDVSAADECGEIGAGTHIRYLIQTDRFMERVNAKTKG